MYRTAVDDDLLTTDEREDHVRWRLKVAPSLSLSLSVFLMRTRPGSPIKEQLFGCQNLASLRRILRWCSNFYGHILSHFLHFFLLFAAGGGAESNWYHNSVISNWRKPKLTLSRVYQQTPIIYGFTIYRG